MLIKVKAQRLRILMVILLLIPLFCLPTQAMQGQVKEPDVFSSVPSPLRARLIERLTLLIEYQRTQQWEKIYDLLSELYTQGQSKERFTARHSSLQSQGLINKLVDFTPKSIAVHNESADHGQWTLFGCAKLSEDGQIRYLYASVAAWREKGDWFFSEVGIITPIDGSAQRCPY